MSGTEDPTYAARLADLQGARWKRFVPNPYRWYLRHLRLGRVLDVGCGVGRSLGYLDGNGVGVDHNPDAVARCRARGLEAHLDAEWSPAAAAFDALLCLHVLEHLTEHEGLDLLRPYIPALRPGGRVVLITPQQRGQTSDPTHVREVGPDQLRELATELGLVVDRVRSFPLPPWCGRWFVYNEHVLEGHRPS